MQCDRIQSTLLGKTSQGNADNVLVAPAHAELHRERNPHRGPNPLKDDCNMWQVSQQTTAAVATDHPFRRAAEVEIHHVKPGIFDNLRRFRQCAGIRAEKLCGYRVLVLVV
jgi:hypothetical protein